jgi:type IV pilus biogenesis protein CpaD/CtpE
MTRYPIACVLLSLVAGCASEPPQQTTATATTATTEHCVREYRVGSNIPVQNCSPAMSDADRQRMLDELRIKARPATSSPPGGSGG